MAPPCQLPGNLAFRTILFALPQLRPVHFLSSSSPLVVILPRPSTVASVIPGNSTGDLSQWLQDVATLDIIQELGLNVIAVGAVTSATGSASSVAKWIATLGDRATYLVVLN